jgi:hypothetical protein
MELKHLAETGILAPTERVKLVFKLAVNPIAIVTYIFIWNTTKCARKNSMQIE